MTKEQFKSYKKKIEQLQMQLYIFKQDFLYERDSESEKETYLLSFLEREVNALKETLNIYTDELYKQFEERK